MHLLSLRFHLERKTGGLTRVLERGRNGIETIVRMVILQAAPTVVELMLDEESTGLAELEAHVGRLVRLQTETGYPIEQFDVVPL